ncbi:MAG: hypothetical protein J6Y37_05970 [Paludibacteraceae bacterium]|nr:hypothetical protein [Paludibacteraceae bacterium]
MDPYIKKSMDNLAAADSLVSGDCYEASAHSAYYSIYLLSKELLNSRFCVGYEEQKRLVNGPKSHQKFIKKFTECLNTVSNFEPNDFVQWFYQTNMLRNKADYKPEKLRQPIYEANVKYALDFAKGINDKFKLY